MRHNEQDLMPISNTDLYSIYVTTNCDYLHHIGMFYEGVTAPVPQIDVSPIVLLLGSAGCGSPQGDVLEYVQNTPDLDAVLFCLPAVLVTNETTTCGLITPQVGCDVMRVVRCVVLSGV